MTLMGYPYWEDSWYSEEPQELSSKKWWMAQGAVWACVLFQAVACWSAPSLGSKQLCFGMWHVNTSSRQVICCCYSKYHCNHSVVYQTSLQSAQLLNSRHSVWGIHVEQVNILIFKAHKSSLLLDKTLLLLGMLDLIRHQNFRNSIFKFLLSQPE